MKITRIIRIITAIVRKNIRRLTRSKVAALMIILGPLIIMILAGIAFDQAKLYGIKVGIYDPAPNNITTEITKSISDHDFKIIPYTTADGCVQSVRDGDTNLCIEFSKNNGRASLQFHVDYSKLNLVYTLINILSNGLQSQSSQISLGLAQNLFTQIGQTSQIIQDNSKIINDMYENMVSLNEHIDSISSSIDAVNVTLPTLPNTTQTASQLEESNDQVSGIQSTIDSRLQIYQTELSQLNGTVTQTDAQIGSLDEDTTNIKSNLSDVYSRLNCNTTQYLFDQLDSAAIAQKLQETPDSTCALVYSTEKMLTDRTSSISQAKTQMTMLKEQVAQAQGDLVTTKSSVSDTASTAQMRISQIQTGLIQVEGVLGEAKTRTDQLASLKMNLKSEFLGIQTNLSNGISDLSKFNQSIAQVVATISNLSGGNAEGLVNPIDASVQPILANKNILDYLFPSLLVFVLTVTGILLSATIVMKEKASPAFFRNFITPVPIALFVIGSYITALLILLSQAAILFIIGSFAFGVAVFSNFLPTIIVLLLACSVFISIGMTIGYFFKTEETTTLAAISLACVLLLFSSLIVPIENVKTGLAFILQASPFVISDTALQGTLIFGRNLLSLWQQVLALIVYVAGFFYLSYITLNHSMRKLEKD